MPDRDSTGAEIIAFPRTADHAARRHRTAVERLARAAERLEAARAEEGRQLAGFREKMDRMGDVARRLSANMQRYREEIAAIDVGRLHRRAKRLAEIMAPWADGKR